MRKNVIIQGLAVLTALLLIIFPGIAASGAEKGLKLWEEKLIPSLFPFMFASAMLTYSGVMEKITAAGNTKKKRIDSSFAGALAVGIISGFPAGAAAVKDAVRKRPELKHKAEKAIWYCTFASPVFIMNTVGGKLLGSRKAGILILAADYISFLILFLIFVRKNESLPYALSNEIKDEERTWGKMLKDAVLSASSGIIMVGGCTVIFSVAIAFIESVGFVRDNDLISAIVSGLLEVSNGTAFAAGLDAPFAVRTALAAFAVSWGGLSVNAQIAGLADECEIDTGFFMKMSFIHGVLAAGIVSVLQLLCC